MSRSIADLVERVYNVPAAGKVVYRPLFGKWLLLQSGAFKKVSSQAPGFQNWGSVDEAQISVWIPVEAGRVEDGEFIGERIGMAVPYILVNNPMSYAGGREIYGFPKTLGIFDPPTSVGDPLTVQAFGGQFSAQSEAGWHRLFELRRTGTPPAGGATATQTWCSLAEVEEALPPAWAGLADDLPEVSLLKSILAALTGHETTPGLPQAVPRRRSRGQGLLPHHRRGPDRIHEHPGPPVAGRVAARRRSSRQPPRR